MRFKSYGPLIFPMLLALMISGQSFAALKYQPGNYKIDPDHSRLGFIIKHLVVSEVEGRFNAVTGSFMLAPKFENSTVNAVVESDSIDTSVKKRDDHLRTKDFFDVATYPTMTLKSKKFKGRPEDFTLVADMTIKDVTKEVIFKGKITGFVKDSWNNERAAAQMTGKINRKDFHIMYNDKIPLGPVVGDVVTINVRTEGIKEVVKEPAKDTGSANMDNDNTP